MIDDILAVWGHWNTSESRVVDSPVRRFPYPTRREFSLIKRRLDQGYSVGDLTKAIDAVLASDWHIEHHHHDLASILRHNHKLQKYIRWHDHGKFNETFDTNRRSPDMPQKIDFQLRDILDT